MFAARLIARPAALMLEEDERYAPSKTCKNGIQDTSPALDDGHIASQV